MEIKKPIISLTSWRKRINTVGKTIFSIIKNCKNFEKIVLVLSIEEFPKKESELPADIKILLDSDTIEILWVEKNIKCFKKILYTIAKYKNNPIISADDDCLYNIDYVTRLYEAWQKDTSKIYSYRVYKYNSVKFQHGPAAIYPPNCFGELGIKYLDNANILNTWHDDVYYGLLAKKLKIEIIEVERRVPYTFHDANEPLSRTLTKSVSSSIRIIDAEISK